MHTAAVQESWLHCLADLCMTSLWLVPTVCDAACSSDPEVRQQPRTDRSTPRDGTVCMCHVYQCGHNVIKTSIRIELNGSTCT